MAVQQMKKIHLCAWKSSRGNILEMLQRRGIVQIASLKEDGYFERVDADALRSRYEKKASDTERVLEFLNSRVPEKKSLFASLEGKKEISGEEYRRAAAREPELLSRVEALLEAEQELEQIRVEKLRLSAEGESLWPWMNLDIPLAGDGTRTTAVLIGTLPGQRTRDEVISLLKAEDPALDCFEAEVLGSASGQTCLCILCFRKEKEALEGALRKLGFAKPAVTSALAPAAYAEELEKEKKKLEEREEKIGKRLEELAGQREQLRFLSDYYTMQAGRYREMSRLLQSAHVFFLSGYVPADQAGKLKADLEDAFPCGVELEDPGAEEEVPVLLKNNGFAKPTESVVESYGLPGRGEIDPTAVMAFFYYFFFGMMLSDAGYGIVMTVGCLLARKKFPHMEEGLRRMLTMFLYCGISTTIWGILFGGYFGDVIPIAAETFFHREVTVPALWFAPLDDPMRLLLFSLLFGLLHLFAGLAVKAYLLLRERKYMDCVCEVGFWYMLLTGLILMLLPSKIFASMAGISPEFPAWLNLLAQILAAAGAAGIVLMAGRKRKNFGIRLALGAYELYGVTSWLSDLLSYSRLLALGIATGVIASVINTMAAMAGGGIPGAVVFTVVFLAGHTLNLAINLLGAYVHTNRLQYVEFFGKFYEGNGKPFRPFSAKSNKYFDVKEEN